MLCFILLPNAGREHPTDTMCPLHQAGAGRCRLSSPCCGSWALVLSFYCRRGAVHVVGSILAVQHPVRMQGFQHAGCSGEAFPWLVGHNSKDSRNQIFEQSLQTGKWSKRCFVSRFKSLWCTSLASIIRFIFILLPGWMIEGFKEACFLFLSLNVGHLLW